MSERQPRKPGLVPSPVILVIFLVSAALVIVGGLSLFANAMNSPVSSQPGAVAAAPATATVVESEPEPNYDLTPTRVLPPPTNAPLPPGFKTPTELPPPTEINYTPGPTASFQELAPLEEWKEYVNEKQGFSIKYPPNWYLNPGPTGQTTQIFSYDFNDPTLTDYKGPSLDLTRIDIMVNREGLSPVDEFRPSETLREWVHRTRLGEGDQLIEEEELTVDGLPALRQIVNFEYGGLIEGVYVKGPKGVILIGQHYRADWTVPNQVFDLLVQSFRIQK